MPVPSGGSIQEHGHGGGHEAMRIFVPFVAWLCVDPPKYRVLIMTPQCTPRRVQTICHMGLMDLANKYGHDSLGLITLMVQENKK